MDSEPITVPLTDRFESNGPSENSNAMNYQESIIKIDLKEKKVVEPILTNATASKSKIMKTKTEKKKQTEAVFTKSTRFCRF